MKKTKLPSFVTIVILTTITLVFWVFFTVYRIFSNKPSPEIPPGILEPVTPTLNIEALNKIKDRTFLSESEVGQTQIGVTGASPTPSPSLSPSPTPSASPSATPTASGSAQPAI